MPRAADGTPMHSFSRAKHHDAMSAEKKPKPAMDKPAEKPSEKPAEDSGKDIKSVVAEHGPAHHIEYEHDKESNKHKVHSKHGEANHDHHAEHDSPEEAHKHMSAAMGQDDEEPEDEEQLGEEAGEALPEMESSHSRIPGLG